MAQRLLRKSTVKVAEALQMALIEHSNLRKTIVCAEGILIALIEQKDSIFTKIIIELGKDEHRIRREIIDKCLMIMNRQPEMTSDHIEHIQLSQEITFLFTAGERISRHFGDTFISTGALFLAFFDDDIPEGQQILMNSGLEYSTCLNALDQVRGNSKITEKDSESRLSIMKEYTVDLTLEARRGRLDPVIGRDDEINRVIQILSRRKKNNPLLIGEPGVGKTVIIEGLANRIAQADVPSFLVNRKLLSLEIGNLLAGAKMQGDFEERLKMIKDEVIASSGDMILFIDEIHTVVGAGRTQGALDASNMLKPALSGGLLQCVGATTLKEYKKFIEADKALARRFQQIKVEEPTPEITVEILKGIKKKYEEHHQIEYTADALWAAADLSARYQPDRFLPDKAIDLLDEAGSLQRLRVIYTPPRIRDLERKRQALLDQKSQAFNEQDFESMAKYQMEITKIEDNISKQKKVHSQSTKEIDRFVDKEEIADLVSRSTGIPVNKIIAKEASKLKNLEESLALKIVGQEHAIKSVADAIRRNRSGLKNSSAPIASFLFLGPTGVGKTELTKAIADEVLNDRHRIIRIDMSEFMERHDVSKLIGSPPGYIGYGEGGQLTEAVRHQPYSVVLFDELEKAHKDVFNLLLQVLDEGWLTNGEGRKVSFQNCIIIGTSNLGSDILTGRKSKIGIGSHLEEWSKDENTQEIFSVIKNYFRPEFLNRLDEIIIFNALTKSHLGRILDILITSLKDRLSKLNCKLDFSELAKEFILNDAEIKNYGARPLKRSLEKLVENKVASILISGLNDNPKTVVVNVDDGELVVSMR